MKNILLLSAAFLAAACAATTSLSDQPVIVSNGARAPLYYRAIGLNAARAVKPEKAMPLSSDLVKELKPGHQVLLEAAKAYASEGGLAILIYRIGTTDGATQLLFAGLQEVSIRQLEKGIPIVLE